MQDVRRKEGLHVSDRIHLRLDCRDHREIHDAVVAHKAWVMEQTLALELDFVPLVDAHRGELPDGRAVHIAIHKLTS